MTNRVIAQLRADNGSVTLLVDSYKTLTHVDDSYSGPVVLAVTSQHFSGQATIWFNTHRSLEHFCSEVTEMYKKCVGKITFGDEFEGNTFSMSVTTLGRLNVIGTIQDFRGNTLDFEFEGDQTRLPPFIEDLGRFMEKPA